MAKIFFEIKDGMIGVCTPFHPKFVNSVKKIRGRRWDATRKMWWVPVGEEALLRGKVDFHFDLDAEESVPTSAPYSNIMDDADVILGNVHSILSAMNENGGSISDKILRDHYQEWKGNYYVESVAVASVSVGEGHDSLVGRMTEQQLEWFVERVHSHDEQLMRSLMAQRNGGRESSSPAEDDGSSTSEIRFGFGKYQGKRLDEVPASYLKWILSHAKVLAPRNRGIVDAIKRQLEK